LTEAQTTALKKIYAGSSDAAGKPIYPGYPPGGEAGPTAWSLWISGSEPARTSGGLMNGFSTGFFGNFVFNKKDWGVDGVNVGDALTAAQQATGKALDSNNPDLSAFQAAGGKLIQYHGWNDSGISPRSSILWYEDVASKLGGVDRIASFYRLFMAPGMDHCGGGPGPNAIGGVFGSPSVSRDPGHDVVAALAHWVEDGVAPERIVATRYRDNDPSKGIEAQRPWCAYPATARYSGQGERSIAANYTCVTPAK
jgi:feruloyl esterase